MNLPPYELASITVPDNRQRQHFDGAKIIELANSIQSVGLLQPLLIAHDGSLVAGERRFRALKHLAALGIAVRCGDVEFPVGTVPVLLFGDSDRIKLYEAELDENIKREDLTWQEKCAAIDMLHSLRVQQNPGQTVSATAEERFGRREGTYATLVTEAVILSKHMQDAEVAKAASPKDAMKILRKREEKQRLTRLAETINVKALSDVHRLHQGDFRGTDLPSGSVDVVLTDPPYGMGADSFKDGGGAVEVLHSYDDVGGEDWELLVRDLAVWSIRVTKPQAHLYVFCDIDKFAFLKSVFADIGWRVHRTPLVYAKSHASSRRVPWPEHGPRRGYELILYAVKGDKRVNHIKSDVLGPFATDDNLGHAAQKPVELYTELLARSIAPGNVVCDPFCGTGPIFPAAHTLKCIAIGTEKDPAFFTISSQRLEALKERS